MASTNSSSAKTSRLAKLTKLEKEVAKLSEQLKQDKQTILLLNQSLAERDLRIHELESKLAYAEHSLLGKAITTIHQCKEHIINGFDEKIISPALTQIQQQITVIQGIANEARVLIGKQKILLNEGINAASGKVQQCPDQAVRYFEQWVVEPARIWVNETTGLVDNKVRSSRYIIEHKVVYPGKIWYDKMASTAQALPGQGLAIADNAGVLAKKCLDQLTGSVEQGVAQVADAVKKSQFWDGRRTVEVMQ
ncbi:MAG: hypothetical protein Q7U38_18545 [Methylobacter sp.]|nr:hypothetical protein [Methylobacter sp.]MDP2097919.1 hypothetical protein [Methylobacter sp.]MDP2429211.1 hypothetical protein [Methylobacter sp.]MDP3056307.1 hypothetical protein [Methylobacter sp.]MDP3362303.1 hypothetical protein [Methylobacter sp.]